MVWYSNKWSKCSDKFNGSRYFHYKRNSYWKYCSINWSIMFPFWGNYNCILFFAGNKLLHAWFFLPSYRLVMLWQEGYRNKCHMTKTKKAKTQILFVEMLWLITKRFNLSEMKKWYLNYMKIPWFQLIKFQKVDILKLDWLLDLINLLIILLCPACFTLVG